MQYSAEDHLFELYLGHFSHFFTIDYAYIKLRIFHIFFFVVASTTIDH